MPNLEELIPNCHQFSVALYEQEEERMNDLMEANWPIISRWITELRRPRLVVDNTAKVTPLIPNRVDISSHLYALFNPAFVQPYPDAWIEIAFGRPGGALDAAKTFSVFDIEKAVDFAERKNKDNFNVYVGVALRQGKKPRSGRASGHHVAAAAHAWVDYDAAGDDERINAILKEHKLTPALVVTTGAVPHPRRHLYFKLDGTVTLEKLEAANESLKNLLGSDDVQNPDRVLRLAGTISYPSADKKGRGYIVELTSLHVNKDARAFKVDELIGFAPASCEIDPYLEAGKESGVGPGRSDADILVLLKASQVKNWHNNMRSAVSSMVCRRMPDSAIKNACAAYCDGAARDADLKVLIDTARKKYNLPNIEPPLEGSPAAENDVIRLNKTHANRPSRLPRAMQAQPKRRRTGINMVVQNAPLAREDKRKYRPYF
jgi:hypothetical protein